MTDAAQVRVELDNIGKSSAIIQSLAELDRTIQSEKGCRYMTALVEVRNGFASLKDRFVTLARTA